MLIRQYRRLSRAIRGWRGRWRLLDLADRLLVTDADEVRRLTGAGTGQAGATVDRLFVDISVIHESDAGTGIQRVVRSLRARLPQAIRPDIHLKTLIVDKARRSYISTDGTPLQGGSGALFFGLDFATDAIFAARHDLADFKRTGGQVWFLLHDLLPLTNPQWFTPASRLKYRRWLRVGAALADGFLCVSPVVANQLAEELRSRYGRQDLPKISVIDLGSDITEADRRLAARDVRLSPNLDDEKLARAALVVGTLEPRKGHADVIDAFDLLWARGQEIPLLLIGRAGWNTKPLQDRIRRHPAHGQLLFWLDDVDDHALHSAYYHCRLAIVPSLAEGYGLPLDEALALGTPVLARDIPVFRRHDEASIRYFAEHAGADAIAAAIADAYDAAAGPRRLTPLRRWEDTARQVARELRCAQE